LDSASPDEYDFEGPVFDENDENYENYPDEVAGHYSWYFEDLPLPLPSQYLERNVDSYLDCNGEG
jgi:hypothetical protein